MTVAEILAQSPGAALLAALLLVLAGGLLVAALVVEIFGSRRSRVQARVSEFFNQPAAAAQAAPEQPQELLRARQTGSLGRFRERMDAALAASGGAGTLLVMIPVGMIAATVAFVLASRVFLASAPLALAIAAGTGLVFARKTLVGRQRKRTLAFLDTLPDAIDLILRAVTAGIPVNEAIAGAARELPEPIRSHFKRIADNSQLGIDLKDSLLEAAERIRLADFDFLVVALIIQRESGGQLAESLQNLSGILRRRKESRLKARALTAEGRLSGKVVAALPFIAGGFIFLFNPAYLMPLLQEPAGRMVLMAAMGCLAIGLLIIGNLTKGEA